MDLLNSQFLDKMNNNVGKLYYDGEFTWFSLSLIEIPCQINILLPLLKSQMRLFWFDGDV